MALVTTTEMFAKALKSDYAVGAFNVNNMEIIQGIMDAAKEEAKIFETARRIAKGAKVPAKDEKKVMDYSMELYMAAKNAAMLANMKKNKKKEEYDSLWDDEEEKSDNPDPREVADNSDYVGPTPEIASADTVVESVSEG